MSPRPFSAVLLAGGHSTRMGRDKALCRWRGRAFWEVLWDLTGRAGACERFVGGPRRAEFPGEVECVPDLAASVGPLGGVTAALARARHPWVLVLAVDMPLLTLEDLGLLLSAPPDRGRVPVVEVGGRRLFEPLVALYPTSLALPARRLLEAGESSIQPLVRLAVDQGLMETWEIPAEAAVRFRSLNDPAELASARERFGAQSESEGPDNRTGHPAR